MAILSPLPVQQYFHVVAGEVVPLAGGKLYFYNAGTSTPKYWYTDVAGTIASTNPLILDSNGYAALSTGIWLGTGSYKMVLTDANDATIWSVDNINGINVAGYVDTYAALRALTGGSSNTVFVRCRATNGDEGGGWFAWFAGDSTADDNGCIIADNGNTGRWKRILNGIPGINVKWYGATGAGATSDVAAISAAATYAATVGLPILFPGTAAAGVGIGIYKIDSDPGINNVKSIFNPNSVLKIIQPITVANVDPIIAADDTTQHFDISVPNSAVTFKSGSIPAVKPEWFYSGSGTYSAAIQMAINSYNVVELGPKTYTAVDLYVDKSNFIIKGDNSTIDCNGAGTGIISLGQQANGTASSTVRSFIKIDGISFIDGTGSKTQHGIRFIKATDITVENCLFSGLGNAIDSQGSASTNADRSFILKNYFTSNGVPIYDGGGSAGWINGGIIERNTFNANSSGPVFSSSITLVDNSFTTAGSTIVVELSFYAPSNGLGITMSGNSFRSIGKTNQSFILLQNYGSMAETIPLNIIGGSYYSDSATAMSVIRNASTTAKWRINAIGQDLSHFTGIGSDVLSCFIYDITSLISVVLTGHRSVDQESILENCDLRNKNTLDGAITVYDIGNRTGSDKLIFARETTNGNNQISAWRVYADTVTGGNYTKVYTRGVDDSGLVERIKFDKTLTLLTTHIVYGNRINIGGGAGWIGYGTIAGIANSPYFSENFYYDGSNPISSHATERGAAIFFGNGNLYVDSYGPNTNPASGRVSHIEVSTGSGGVTTFGGATNRFSGSVAMKENLTCGKVTFTSSDTSATINTTAVTANSIILLTQQSRSGTIGPECVYHISNRTAGASFVISKYGTTSYSVVIGWVIIEPY